MDILFGRLVGVVEPEHGAADADCHLFAGRSIEHARPGSRERSASRVRDAGSKQCDMAGWPMA
jgi:hypothetical protein